MGPNIWHCSFTCSCIFIPVSMLYISMLMEILVYKPHDRHVSPIMFLTLWVASAVSMSTFLTGLPYLVVNPFPMNGAIGASVGIVVADLTIFFLFVPQLGRSIGIEVTTILPKP